MGVHCSTYSSVVRCDGRLVNRNELVRFICFGSNSKSNHFFVNVCKRQSQRQKILAIFRYKYNGITFLNPSINTSPNLTITYILIIRLERIQAYSTVIYYAHKYYSYHLMKSLKLVGHKMLMVFLTDTNTTQIMYSICRSKRRYRHRHRHRNRLLLLRLRLVLGMNPFHFG